MQCTLAEKLIPLFVSDDLPDNEMIAIGAHLDVCPACWQLTAEFSESQTWLRAFAAPAFSDATLEGLRDAVGHEIASARRQPAWFERWMPRWNPRFALAATVVAILVIAALGVFKWPHQPDRPSLLVVTNPDTETPPVKPDEGTHLPASNNPLQYGERERPVTRQHARSGKPRSLTLPVLRPIPVSPEPRDVAITDITKNQEMLRIEMQTADPNIRIIWFALKTDASTQSNDK